MFILLGSFSVLILKPIHEVLNTSAKYQFQCKSNDIGISFQNGLNLIINIQNVFMIIILICMNCRTEMNALNYQTFVESE